MTKIESHQVAASSYLPEIRPTVVPEEFYVMDILPNIMLIAIIFVYDFNPQFSIFDVYLMPWVCPCGILPSYSNLINPIAILPSSSREIHKVHGWTFMKKFGYTIGKGLEKNQNGNVEPHISLLRVGREGLSYNRSNDIP